MFPFNGYLLIVLGDRNMRALIFLVAIVLLMALAGWISFSSTPERNSINLEVQQIEADTDRALESGAKLLQKASDSGEHSNARSQSATHAPANAPHPPSQ